MSIDAALYSGSKTYLFKGGRYIRVTRGDTGAGTVDPGYPASIASAWGWPDGFGRDGIDAALYSGSKTYFFSGDRYIRVTRGDTGAGTVDPGYPASIASAWGWPDGFGRDGIDAALYSGSKTYFFSGDRYIRVTRGDTGAGTVDPGYPASIASAWGWPDGFGRDGIDAALYSGSKTYFFSGDRYIRVTRGDTGAGTVDPGYPASIASAWGWPGDFDAPVQGIDAALYSGSKTYFFAGARYLRVTRGDTGAGTVDPGYPASIASAWGWPDGFGRDGIDAALYSGSKTYFFSGDRYIRVTRGDTGAGTVDPGYPASIASAWGWPDGFGRDGIDAALYSGSKTYFFSGDRYIRVTRGDTGAGTVDPGYPASIASAWGWPDGFGRDGIDAALYSGSKTYFFSGDRYIRVTRGDTGAGTVDPGYPASIAAGWAWHRQPADEISFSVSECVYGWTAAYRQAGTHVTVRVRLNPDAGIPDATMDALRTTWRDGILATWGRRFECRSPDASRQSISFDVQWVTSGQHHTVRVRPGPAGSNMTTWDTSDTGAVASHEFGHMLGHPDEYADSTCPNRSPVSTGTVMDDNSEAVARLYSRIASFHGSGHAPLAAPTEALGNERAPAAAGMEPLMMTNIDKLSPEERGEVLGRLRARGAEAPEAGAADASAFVEVTGGAPGERYTYRVGLRADGTAERQVVDELRGAEPQAVSGEVTAELVQKVFRAADEAGVLDDSAPEFASEQFVPDSLVAIVTVQDGGAERRLVMPASEASVGEPDFSGSAAELPLETRVQVPADSMDRLRPFLDAMHDVEAQLEG